jgi:hypothetical protein
MLPTTAACFIAGTDTTRRTGRQATRIPKHEASFAINPYSKSIILEGYSIADLRASSKTPSDLTTFHLHALSPRIHCATRATPVLLFLLQSAAVSRIMSRTHSSPGPRLEALTEELREKERFMSHGYPSFQYLLEALKSSRHSQCPRVWPKGTVAYRCRTCQIDDWRSASAFAFVFFHTTSISPPSSPRCRLLAIWMCFLDASLFAFFLQFSVVHDCQGDIHVEKGSSADCIGDEGSLISHCFRNAVYNFLNENE